MLLLLACAPSGPDYGAYAPLIKQKREVLAAEPCNEQAVESLATSLQKAGHLDEAVPAVKGYAAACPASQEFEDFEVAFGRDAKVWELALSVHDKRVADRPSDPTLRASRAELREAAGDLPGALRDLRQASLLREREARAEALKDLALMQVRAGKPCDAWQSWTIVAATSRKLKGEAQLAAHKLLVDPACANQPVSGESTFKRGELAGWWTFPVALDGKELALGGDTSSLVTVVAEAAAQRLGLSATGDPWFLRSFQGTVAGLMLHVAEMRIGETIIRDVDVVVLPTVPDGLDGMIGGDVLSRVELKEVSGTNWKVVGR